MHRRPLLELLHRYRPLSEEFFSFVRAHPRCFERELEVGHVTGSAWLLNKAGDAALLLHHAKLDIWVQPGGHCDGDPDVLQVALREAREESGIQGIEPVSTEIFDLDIHSVPGHLHYDVRFLLQVTSDEVLVPNRESKALRWVRDDLPTQEWSVLRMREKWLSRGLGSGR